MLVAADGEACSQSLVCFHLILFSETIKALHCRWMDQTSNEDCRSTTTVIYYIYKTTRGYVKVAYLPNTSSSNSFICILKPNKTPFRYSSTPTVLHKCAHVPQYVCTALYSAYTKAHICSKRSVCSCSQVLLRYWY